MTLTLPRTRIPALTRSPLPGLLVLAFAALAPLTPSRAQEDAEADPALGRSADPRRDAVVRAVERVGPAVANLSSVRDAPSKDGKRLRSLGSGLVIHPLGFLLTNAHVVEGASVVQVTLPGPRSLEARVLSVLPERDLALLRVLAPKPLPTAQLAPTDRILIGETCVALGNPFGLESSVTRGVVSARSRKLRVGGRVLSGTFLQTDAAINPGNSGGPLINVEGHVIGLNTAIHHEGSGIGFAIPVARLRESLGDLSDPLRHRELYLGLRLKDTARGVTVASVTTGGPAAKAGLRKGDQIVAAGPSAIDSVFAFQASVLDSHSPRLRLALRDAQGRLRGAAITAAAPPWRAPLAKRLGLRGRDLDDSLAWRLKTQPGGVHVTHVDPSGPAAELGIEPGDRLFEIVMPDSERGRDVPSQRALARLVSSLPSGSVIELTVRRAGRDYRGAVALR